MTECVVKARPYQAEAIDSAFREFEGGKESTLCVMATGTGKTIVAGGFAHRAKHKHHRRVMFLAHYDMLLYQAQNAFHRYGLSTSVEMADQDAQDYYGDKSDVVLGSIATLRGPRLKSWNPREFGALITDECHHGRADSYVNIFKHFKGYWHLGLTATPDRGDGKNLGAIYESIAFDYNMRRAVRDGYLVPVFEVKCYCDVDLKNVKTTGGDFNPGDLEERISPHVEQLCDIAITEMGSRKTVVFTPDVGSAQLASDCFNHKGRKSAWIAGAPRMSKEEQKEILSQYANGELDVICCNKKLTEGWDDPPTSCVVIMNPTQKRSLFAQMVGRGTRLDHGKEDCLIVNFAWQTTNGMELCTVIDLFDDTDTDDEIVKLAKKLANKPENNGRAASELFDEAEEEFRRKASQLHIKMSGKPTTYSRLVCNPLGVSGVLGVKLKEDWHFSGNGPQISEKQAEFLKRLGVESPETLNRFGASRMIDTVLGRRKRGMASIKQVHLAINLGMDPDAARKMTFSEASGIIDELMKKRRR